VLATAALAFVVIQLGAYVRLSDAGLGCPDWPGCYGRLTVPDAADAAGHASGRPLEAAKAWKEMIHRYGASALGLAIVALNVRAWARGRERTLAAGLLALVVFQGVLGMWTVTWLLKPLVVLAHLLGGLAVLALLWVYALREADVHPTRPVAARTAAARALAWAGLGVLVVQIALGGWTSANYAALACPGFPRCLGEWWPPMRFAGAFVPWHGLGIDYEGGILDSPSRIAIHMTHRAWAVAAALVLGGAAASAWRAGLRGAAAALVLLLGAQLGLGIANVMLYLPLPVAVAHNGGAALLLLGLVTLLFLLHRAPR
jgi:heme a synthase